MDTDRLDLNLLRALDVLLAERNVTRAAIRLHLSQPALSARLARLRVLLADQLLIPAPHGMTPTARALELQGPLRATLDQLRSVLDQGLHFDPAATRMTVGLAASDYMQHAVLLSFVRRLSQEAPGVRVALLPIDGAAIAWQLGQGKVDLALMTSHTAPPDLHMRGLFDETYVGIARRGHPRVRRRLTLDDVAREAHIVVSPRGAGFVSDIDTVLAKLGVRRQVAVSAASFLFVPRLVACSDLIAFVPSRLIRGDVGKGVAGLKQLAPPVELPGFAMAMVWHARTHHHSGHRWIRDRVAEACSQPGTTGAGGG